MKLLFPESRTPNPQSPLIAPILAGLLASGLFFIVFGIGLGFIFLFLPTLPLFYIGLGPRFAKLPLAVGTAAVTIAIVTGLPLMTIFLLFMGLPAWYIAKYSLLWRSEQDWFPIGAIILRLTLIGCAIISLVTLYYSFQPETLPQLLSQNIHETFAELKNDYGDIIDMLAGELSFLMFPVTIWLWAMILYSHAWLMNRLLARRKQQIRPDYNIRPFAIPVWMLTLLVIAALASLIGSESMSFLGKNMMICLMLPYFFQGTALMHRACKPLPSHRFFLFFVYFMVFSQFWPALVLAWVGLWDQVKHLKQTPKT